MIQAKGSVLGDTETGKTWCIKALHPSDPLTDVQGIPDHFSGATTLLNWQRTYTITANTGATGTWDCDITIAPTPSHFGAARRSDSTGATYYEIVNTQLGANHDAAVTACNAAFERWRLAYCGATAYQDGPALSNQGTCAAAQFPAMPRMVPATVACGLPGDVLVPQGIKGCELWQSADLPDFTMLQSMPNAYFGESKDGCYMPLRLSANHQKWHGPGDNHVLGALYSPMTLYSQAGNSLHTDVGASFPIVSVNNSEAAYADNLGALIAAWSTTRMKASLWLPDATSFGAIADANTIAGSTKVIKTIGSLVNAPCNDLAGRMCFRGLSVNTQVVVYLRVGFEVMVQPGTAYAPYLHLSPAFDPTAITAYYKISRELKDAYPADFNDLGKLWEVIKNAARVVLPIAGSVFPAVAPITSAISAMIPPKAAPAAPVMVAPATKKRDSLPAAVVERIQTAPEPPRFKDQYSYPTRYTVESARRKIAKAGQKKKKQAVRVRR